MAPDSEEKGIINWRITTVILFIIFAQQLVCALLYADSPFLIEEYFPGKIGHYAGYLVSMYNIGQIPGCMYWGWHADRFGRKQPLIIITLINGILMILFGMSTNFYVAVTIRFLWGLMDGYLGICKTILSEVCSPDMLPVTTGLIFVSMALASTLGPIIGGYLSDPQELLSGLIKLFPFIKKAPFCIPLAICGFLCLLCCLMVILWVDETLSQEERDKQSKINEGMKKQLSGIFRKRDRCESLTADEAVMVEMSSNNYLSMFKDKMIVISVSLYALEGLIQTTYDTVLPVWLAAEKVVGGFEMDKKDLGWVLSFVSPMQMATLLLFPVVSKVCSTKKSYIILSIVQVFVLAFNPIVSTLNQLSLQNTRVAFLYNTAVYVLIANCCFQEFRAKAYSLSQVLAGLLRFVVDCGPTVIPILFSWSIEKPRPFPFNYGLSMYVLALLTVICVLMTIALPNSVNEGKGSLYDTVAERMEKRRLEKEKEKMKKQEDNITVPLLD